MMLLLTAAGPTPLTRLSQMLKAAHPSMRIHVELSTFADQMTLRDIIEQVVQYSDSLGLNEQELPALRRQLVNWHSTVDSGPETVLEDSAPSLASVLDDARSTFKLLRHLTAHNHRQFSRLHMHTLAFQVITTPPASSLTQITCIVNIIVKCIYAYSTDSLVIILQVG